VAVVIVVGLTAYFQFRNYREERQIKTFLGLLAKQDYRTAYGMWCSEAKPCRDYAFERFMEDWGPQGVHAKMGSGALRDSEPCGTGFIGTIGVEGQEGVALWVEKKDGTMSFAPWSECPEKRFRLMKWLRARFGGS